MELFLFSYFSPPYKKKQKKKRPDHGENIFTTAALTSAFALEQQKKKKKKTGIVHFCFFFLFCFLRSEQASVTRARDGGERTHGNIAGAEREIGVFFFPLSAGPGDFTASCSHVAVTGCQ